MNRIYIFTGKGGVGKTSIAAAHGVQSAKEGKKTLLVSTDMAHNLGDLFGATVGKEPVPVMEYLDIYEIDPGYVMEHDFGEMKESMGKMFASLGEEAGQDFGMFPGMEELFSLLKIAEIYQKGSYERIIVDCAPTGETLSLLKFPELLSWYMEKLFPIGKAAIRVLAPVSQKVFRVELPSREAMSEIERMYIKLSELQEMLRNRETTSIRLVTLPEKMVLEETKRNYMYMNLYDFNVDGLYINRILPKEAKILFFAEWMEIQKNYIRQTEESFGAIPIYRVPWYEEEVRGMKAVSRICKEVLEKEEVFAVKIITKREYFEENEAGYLLKVSIPYGKKEEMDLFQTQTDLIIKLGNFKRNIPLPNVLRNYNVTAARLEDGTLQVQFEKEQEESV